jgi:hypothetical protein
MTEVNALAQVYGNVSILVPADWRFTPGRRLKVEGSIHSSGVTKSRKSAPPETRRLVVAIYGSSHVFDQRPSVLLHFTKMFLIFDSTRSCSLGSVSCTSAIEAGYNVSWK